MLHKSISKKKKLNGSIALSKIGKINNLSGLFFFAIQFVRKIKLYIVSCSLGKVAEQQKHRVNRVVFLICQIDK